MLAIVNSQYFVLFDFVKVDDLRRDLNTINEAAREVMIELVSLLCI